MWDSTVMADIRAWGRKAGAEAREEKRTLKYTALPKNFKDKDRKWGATHGQCYAVLEHIERKLLPLLTDGLMADAPGARKLKEKTSA